MYSSGELPTLHLGDGRFDISSDGKRCPLALVPDFCMCESSAWIVHCVERSTIRGILWIAIEAILKSVHVILQVSRVYICGQIVLRKTMLPRTWITAGMI